MSKLELQNVSYVYSEGTTYEKEALKNINLKIEQGMITGIIGHTGSGKSTLLSLLNGLSKPANGKIILDGIDIWEKPKEIGKIRFRVGLVMQYPEYQLFEETVEKDIAFGPTNMGLDVEEIKNRVIESAKFVGLDNDDLKKSPFDLSGGQKRKAAIAGVIAMRPEVLVLDEPCAGLDPIGRDSILNGIREYKDKTKSTIVIVSHSMEDMAKLADRIAVLNKGELKYYGTRDEVFSHSKELKEMGLSVPQVTELINILRENGMDLKPNIYTEEDAINDIISIFERKNK